MSDRDQPLANLPGFEEDAGIPEDEVKSAARSCSAIIVIVIIVVLITCVMASIALIYD